MRKVGRMLVAAMAAAALAACGPDRPGERTDDVTQDLLTSMTPTGSTSELPTGAMPPGRPVAPQGEQTRAIDVALLGVNHGSPDAPVRVVEFSDYGCGYCRQFHDQTWPALLEEFVESGKVEWKFLPFVSGMFRNSPVATEAAECVLEQGRNAYQAMHARLWQDQGEWKGAADAEQVVAGYAADAGADPVRWRSCMEEGRRNERVDAANALSRQLGVRATPTFFVVGYPPLQGALPAETFRQILNLVHEDAIRRTGG